MSGQLARTMDAAAPEPLVRRARACFTQLGNEQIKNTYWTTFWLPRERRDAIAAGRAQPGFARARPAHARPAHAIEELVVALWTLAAPGPACAGVEWWLGRAHTTKIPVGFHFDQDVKGKRGFRHPKLSSVFFFNQVKGGQLAITDQRAGPRGEPRPAQAGEMAVIVPKRNRYAIFAGDLFHGVLDANGRVPGRALAGPPGKLRLTLVINYWERRPTGVPLWSESRAYPSLRR